MALRPDPGGQPFQVGHSSKLDFRAGCSLGLGGVGFSRAFVGYQHGFRLNPVQVVLLQVSSDEALTNVCMLACEVNFMQSCRAVTLISCW